MLAYGGLPLRSPRWTPQISETIQATALWFFTASIIVILRRPAKNELDWTTGSVYEQTDGQTDKSTSLYV